MALDPARRRSHLPHTRPAANELAPARRARGFTLCALGADVRRRGRRIGDGALSPGAGALRATVAGAGDGGEVARGREGKAAPGGKDEK